MLLPMPRSAFVTLAFAASLFLTLPLIAVEPSKDSIETIKKNIADGKAVMIDVREADEWDAGHLKDAKNLSLKTILAGIEQEELDKVAPKDKIVYLHCAAGFRCLEAAKTLEGRHPNLQPLKQGYDALLKAGFPKADKE